MRWLPFGKAENEEPPQPTPYDRWLAIARWGALLLALALFGLSVVPPVMQASGPNAGADVNITAEFYTAFDGGGGYVSWDFDGSAAREVRAVVDRLGDGNGVVEDSEFASFSQVVDDRLTGSVLRHFEIVAARLIEQSGFIGKGVNATEVAHFKMIVNGQWVKRDNDVRLSRDGALTAAFPNLTASETVRDRTIIVSGGFSSFVSSSLSAHALRVPGGCAVVSVDEYFGNQYNESRPADLRFERFSVLNSSLLLLAPLAIAFLLGVRGPRLEQEAARQRRVVPFHAALAAGFLLLIVAYFAGAPGLAMWVGGAGFGAFGMWAAYKLYPSNVPYDSLERPVGRVGRKALRDGERVATPDEAMAFMSAAHGPVGSARAAGAPAGAGNAAPSASATAYDALAMMDAAHKPLQEPAQTFNQALVSRSQQAEVSAGPLSLPEEDTRRPEGRVRAAPAPKPPAPGAPPAAPAPAAAPAAAEVPRTVIRCPGCRHQFEAVGHRPLPVTCPHCGRKGLLR